MSRGPMRVVLMVAAAGVLLIALGLIRLADQFPAVTDISASARHTLTPPSVDILELLQGPIHAQVLIPDNPELKRGVSDFFRRYQQHKRDFELSFIDPREELETARKLGAQLGEIVLEFKGRTERVKQLDESTISNALARLLRGEDRFVALLNGNGERRVSRQANHDFSQFGQRLSQRGIKTIELRLGEIREIPGNTALLMLASPSVPYTNNEIAIINRYVAAGGNLLWFCEPEQAAGFAALASALGVTRLPGTVVDPIGLTKFNNPAYAVATRPLKHALFDDFDETLAFPYAAALLPTPNAGWEATALLKTSDTAWTETGEMAGNVGYDGDDEIQGALNLALLLSREYQGKQQRVIVLGDGDFLSNTFAANLGHLAFGQRLVEWLAADDQLIDIQVPAVADSSLEFAMWQRLLVFMVFGLLIPLGFAANGILLWWQRRHA